MSVKPAISEKVFCDLCKKEIDAYSSENRSCLNWGIIARPTHKGTQRFTFLPNWWRNQKGERRGMYPQWDFHTSCLTDLLRPLVEGQTT